jgi:dynein heavy chain
LENIADHLKKLLVFLGPSLKQVTGNSEGIDNLVEKVKQMVKCFENSNVSFFDKEYFG